MPRLPPAGLARAGSGLGSAVLPGPRLRHPGPGHHRAVRRHQHGLADRLNIEQEEAGAYIDRYFERFPAVKRYIEETIEFAKKEGGKLNIGTSAVGTARRPRALYVATQRRS